MPIAYLPPSKQRSHRPPMVRRFRLHRLFSRTLLARLLVAGGVLVVAGAFSFVALFAWYSRDLPDPKRIRDRDIEQSTKIYDRTGERLLYEIHGEKKRTVIDFAEIPETVKWATITAEDRDFYKHKGFDLKGILRAVLRNILTLDPSGQGGSTITQQFIKNSILTSEKTVTRKLKELVLAYQIERRFTKDEILALYFNEIPYGSNAYGVEAASQTYFGKSAKELTLAESALIASLPQAPTFYSPYGNHVDRLNTRQHLILDAMVDQGYITREQADAAKQEKLVYRERRDGITAPHFVFYVRELLAGKYGERTVEQGGLKVTTTLDMEHQEAAEAAIAEFGERNATRYNATNAGLVSIDPHNGKVLAMVGSRDYFDTEHDGNVNVTLSPRQPGSSFKPIVYLTAFERGYTPETMLFDLVTNFSTGSGKPYTPHNYDGREHGPLSMRKALAGSLNIPAVKTLYLASIKNVLDNADKLGYTTLKERDRYGLSLTLGGGEVRLLDHTSAFATLANEGVRNVVTPILKVEDRHGKTLEEFKKHEIRVFDTERVRQLTSILTDNSARSFIFGANSPLVLPDRPVAAKTGTTNDFRDGWTMGFTPSLAAGVWTGNNDNTPLKRGADGVVVAAPIWHSYMARVLKGTTVEQFKKPRPDPVEKGVLRGQIDVVRRLPVDKVSKRVIPESCRDTYPKQFVVEQDFKETHTILHWVERDNPRGAAPENPAADPQYGAWEAPVRSWASKRGYPDLKKLQYEDCHRRDVITKPAVTITAPTEGATITTQTTTFSADASSTTEKISSVVFALDGITIGTKTSTPYSIAFTNTWAVNGQHTLTVTATDALGTESSARSVFSSALPESLASVRFTKPQANAVFRTTDFPLSVVGTVFAPSGATSVQLFAGDGLLASGEARNGTHEFSIASLSAGNQTLVLRVATAADVTLEATLPLTIQSDARAE